MCCLFFFLLNWMQEFTWPWTVFLQDCYEYAFRYNMLLLHLCCMFMYEDIPFGSATVSLWLPKCTVMFFFKKLFVFIARYLWCFVLFVLLASLCVNVFFYLSLLHLSEGRSSITEPFALNFNLVFLFKFYKFWLLLLDIKCHFICLSPQKKVTVYDSKA